MIAIENGPVEIVDLPSDSMVIFYSYVSLPEDNIEAIPHRVNRHGITPQHIPARQQSQLRRICWVSPSALFMGLSHAKPVYCKKKIWINTEIVNASIAFQAFSCNFKDV